MTTKRKALFKTPPRYLIDQNGNRVSVVLDMETFERILKQLNIIHDNLLMDEVEGEPTESWEDVKADLRKVGKL